MAGSNFARYMIHVANIPWTVGRHELALYFSQFGCVQDVIVAFDKKTGLHKNHGHVAFLKKQDMDKVLDHKHSLEGKDLILSIKKYSDNDSNNGSTLN